MRSSAENTPPLRVLIAAPLGQGGRGGIDRIMDNLASAARLTPGPTGPEGVVIDILPTRGGGHALNMIRHMMRFMATLLARKATGHVDLVHINVSQRGSVTRKALLARMCSRLGVPYVVHVHGSQFHTYWTQGGPKAQHRLRALIGGAARVIVLGNFWREFLIGVGADPSRLVIVPNATPHPAQANPHRHDSPARILFLGRMGERKGVPQLVQALGRIQDIGPWRATLAGDGAVEEIRAQVAQLGLAERVDVSGWAGPDEVSRLLASHDILVLPSFDENLPMSVIEGMAHGMGVVATPVGAVPDILIDGETGLLVTPGDVDSLAEALGRLIADPALRERLGGAARTFHAGHLDLAGYPHRILAVWRDALGDHAPMAARGA